MITDKLMRYSIQLAFLKKLNDHGLINNNENTMMKKRLMKDYKIDSDFTANNIIQVYNKQYDRNTKNRGAVNE